MFLGEAIIPDGQRVYAIGDIHGRLDLLERMLGVIDADIAANPASQPTIMFLGDYVDRGPNSSGVVDRLVSLADDPRHVMLRGNHDQRLQDFVDDADIDGEAFLYWGGLATVASYGVDVTGEHTPQVLSRELARVFPSRHRRFLQNLPYYHSIGDYFFVHAGVRPGVPLDAQDSHDLMWIRRDFLVHQGSFGKVIIHGHTPVDWVDAQPNRINVDTCAYDSGVLSCVVLEGNKWRSLHAELA
ncbi:MAG: metallophosphoesterase family protein [Nitratireductor sp.]